MKIWITRHGQTALNKQKLMQGLTDEPLNETGIQQAKEARKKIGDIHFDAVYASPLQRAIQTASIIGNVDQKDYELRNYFKLGLKMTSYWAFPELLPNPKSVESVKSMVKRSQSFLKELEKQNYENVLIVCHGGIIRSLCGYLEDRKNGIKWRPKPNNCEIRVYESNHGKHTFIKTYK